MHRLADIFCTLQLSPGATAGLFHRISSRVKKVDTINQQTQLFIMLDPPFSASSLLTNAKAKWFPIFILDYSQTITTLILWCTLGQYLILLSSVQSIVQRMWQLEPKGWRRCENGQAVL